MPTGSSLVGHWNDDRDRFQGYPTSLAELCDQICTLIESHLYDHFILAAGMHEVWLPLAQAIDETISNSSINTEIWWCFDEHKEAFRNSDVERIKSSKILFAVDTVELFRKLSSPPEATARMGTLGELLAEKLQK